MLGGVRIPHSHGLIAHSDGDVILHALCDAMLGSLALGDIGVHFPPGEAEWKGADSRALLREVSVKAARAGWRVGNVDVTVMAESPKVGPHVSRMRAFIAHDLECEVDAISVKATTTEGLGFVGRSEGIAATVVVLLVAVGG